MKTFSNYIYYLFEITYRYLDTIELSVGLLIFHLIIYHQYVNYIIYEKYFDNCFSIRQKAAKVGSHSLYKQVRYYSLKSIECILLFLVTLIIVYEFFKYTDIISKNKILFGLIGAAFTFALQEVVLSFAGWLAISCGSFYFFGDRIKLGNIVGDVIDIGFLRTTLLECGDWVDGDLYNGRIVRVANSFVFKEPVYNYNAKFRFLWDEIKLFLTHESDFLKAHSILKATINEYFKSTNIEIDASQEWNKITNIYFVEAAETEPTVNYVIDRNAIEFTIRYIVEYKKRRKTKTEIFQELLSALRKSGIKASIAKVPLDIWLSHKPEELIFQETLSSQLSHVGKYNHQQ